MDSGPASTIRPPRRWADRTSRLGGCLFGERSGRECCISGDCGLGAVSPAGPSVGDTQHAQHGSESGLTERIGGKKKESSWLQRHPEDSDAELFGFSLIVHNGTVLPQAQHQVTFDGVALT